MQDYIERFRAARVVPVIVLDDPARAVPLAKALLAQGITAAEVTFRTPAAEESIRRIAAEVPDIFVGAGTVLTEDELARAHAAGAQFAVAPGLDPAILDAAAELGLPFCPGVATASEFMAAIRLGCRMVKFFPARDAGGIPLLKSLPGLRRGMARHPAGRLRRRLLDGQAHPRLPLRPFPNATRPRAFRPGALFCLGCVYAARRRLTRSRGRWCRPRWRCRATCRRG